ncbi:MAG TPA: hypothetical protein VGD37_43365 [Kofleriaceae bacterium]|jgi:hypothetical protein
MRKTTRKKLALARDIVRTLAGRDLAGVAGGKNVTAVSTEPACQSVNVCPTTTCPGSGVFCSNTFE